MKVLFIGATGFVGSYVIPILKDRFDLTLFALNNGQLAGLPVQQIDLRLVEVPFSRTGQSGNIFRK